MTSSRVLLLAAAAAVVGACGNYSNDDLLFMSAVPSRTELAVVLPQTSNPNAADLAQQTEGAIGGVNTMLDNVLGLIDTVRSYEPTSRSSSSRTWGPFDDDKNPGWRWQLVVTLEPDGTTFDYWLETEDVTAATPVWLQFFTGTFDASGGIEQGNGAVTVDFAALENAGFPLDVKAAALDTVSIAYQNHETPGSPVSVTLTITQPPDTNGVTAATFMYEILTDGSGEISFTLVGNIIPGPAIDTVVINAQWIPTGAGQATEAIVAGDGAGLVTPRIQCWDASFNQTYNTEPWMPSSNFGDPSACQALPTF